MVIIRARLWFPYPLFPTLESSTIRAAAIEICPDRRPGSSYKLLELSWAGNIMPALVPWARLLWRLPLAMKKRFALFVALFWLPISGLDLIGAGAQIQQQPSPKPSSTSKPAPEPTPPPEPKEALDVIAVTTSLVTLRGLT